MQQIDMVKIVLNLLKKASVILLTILLSLTLIISLQYYHTEIFDKQLNNPFSGDEFYNPYSEYTGNTLKANFHAHSAAWLNLTNGNQQPFEIYNHYRNKGYDLISLSNYHKITWDKSASVYIPVYEHGYNIKKSHQLVITSESENYFDFPVFQSYHNKQQVLKKMKDDNNLIALAHPNLWEGYSREDMRYLRGYDLIEVYNNYRTSKDIWDAALSSGYPTWILADDDVHDISNPDLSFNNWTRIGVIAKSRSEVIAALKKGCHYGVRNKTHQEMNYLDSCKLYGNEIQVHFNSKADSILFISDNGEIMEKIYNQASASYKISNENSYVRTDAFTGEEIISLNPVIRYDGNILSQNLAFPNVNIVKTLLYRAYIFSISSILLIIIILMHRKNRLIILAYRNLKALKIRI